MNVDTGELMNFESEFELEKFLEDEARSCNKCIPVDNKFLSVEEIREKQISSGVKKELLISLDEAIKNKAPRAVRRRLEKEIRKMETGNEKQ